LYISREGLIKSCWRQEYKRRPGAAEVAAFLADSPRLLAPCLDVPLDALSLDAELPPSRAARDRAEVHHQAARHAYPFVETYSAYLFYNGFKNEKEIIIIIIITIISSCAAVH
jgi:hypothetical protein